MFGAGPLRPAASSDRAEILNLIKSSNDVTVSAHYNPSSLGAGFFLYIRSGKKRCNTKCFQRLEAIQTEIPACSPIVEGICAARNLKVIDHHDRFRPMRKDDLQFLHQWSLVITARVLDMGIKIKENSRSR